MNDAVLVRTNAQSDPSIILFGRDNAGKPRASWFDAVSADLATKAAEQMSMRILKLETEEHRAVARQVAPGRVFANGRAFTPFARATVFSKLVEFAHVAQQADGPSAGTEVAASDGNGATAVPGGFGTASGSAVPPPPKRPLDWDEIGIGSVVLATSGLDEGWWESVVIGVNGEAFSLKWRDYPGEPVFVRRRSEVALLPSDGN